MHNDINTAIEDISTPISLFTYPQELDPTDIAGTENTPTETPQDNGVTSPILTHLSLPNSPTVDTPEVPASPPPCTCADASAASCLLSKDKLPGVFLTSVDNALFSVYQNWVHQNPDTQLDGGINKDGKCQVIWKTFFVCPPNAMVYHLGGSVKGLSQNLQWISTAYRVGNGTLSR